MTKISALRSKLEVGLRYGLVYNFSNFLPLYIVNEHPKSGGTWVAQMLSSALDLPFFRNQIPSFCTSIIHGHYLNPRGLHNVLVVWRDGRDVMVSWYHHSFFLRKDGRNKDQVKVWRNNLNFDNYKDVKNNLPEFIEYCFTRKQHSLRFTWSDFVKTWLNQPNVVYVKYEDLRGQPVAELLRVVYRLAGLSMDENTATRIVEEYSFERLTGRRPGQENSESFLRKGIVGDWKNYFSPEACKIFNYYAGRELVSLGYEEDHTWIYR